MSDLAYLLNELTDKNVKSEVKVTRSVEVTLNKPGFNGYESVASINRERKTAMFYFPYDIPGVDVSELRPLIRFLNKNGYRTNLRKPNRGKRSQ